MDQVAEQTSDGEHDGEDEDTESNQSSDAIMQSPNDLSPSVKNMNGQNPAASLSARGRQVRDIWSATRLFIANML